jgi:hypothetical protein
MREKGGKKEEEGIRGRMIRGRREREGLKREDRIGQQKRDDKRGKKKDT